MGLIITTKDDDIAEVKTTKGSDVFINGKKLNGVQAIEIKSPAEIFMAELSIRFGITTTGECTDGEFLAGRTVNLG